MALGLVHVLAASLITGCTAVSGANVTPTPTPTTHAAQTADALAAPTPAPIYPTASILIDAVTNRPIWPTPLPTCAVSASNAERPDLGPTIGESPIWLASEALPIVPWRNGLFKAVAVVDRSADGELILSGRGTSAEGPVQFLRQGGDRPTDQLHVPAVAHVGSTATSPIAARYADVQLFVDAPKPGCYDLQARLGDLQRDFTIEIYN